MKAIAPPSKISSESAKTADYWLLHIGIKSLLKCDEAETVRGIARYVMRQYQVLRVGADFVERRRHTSIPPIAAFLGAVTRFLEVRNVGQKNGIVWVARLENERREIEKLLTLLPEIEWTEITLRRPPDGAAISALPRRIFPLRRRIFKLVRHLLRRDYEFFRILRVVEMIGYYAGFLELFQKADFKLAVVSSHSNPHGIAFNLAARRCGIPVMLVTHGMPVVPVAKLSFDLAVVHCEAARQIYIEEGCRIEQFFVHGRRQDFRPMPETLPDKNLTAGIFLCKDINENRLIELIEQLLREPKISRILIRPHPKNLFVKFDEWLDALDSKRIERSFNQSVFLDLEKSNIVFGGNSSVLIEAVTAGKPACYVSRLDYGSEDLHRLVAEKLIYQFGNNDRLDFSDVLNFYHHADWIKILSLFADFDRDESLVNEQISVAIQKLINK